MSDHTKEVAAVSADHFRDVSLALYFSPQVQCAGSTSLVPSALSLPPPTSIGGYVSPLMETTAIVLPPSLLPRPPTRPSHTPGFITILDLLEQAGFQLCGLKMAVISKERARAVCEAVASGSKVSDTVDPHLSERQLHVYEHSDYPNSDFMSFNEVHRIF